MIFLGGSVGKESYCNVGELGSIPGSGWSPGEGNGNPLQHFCLENPMDRGAWQATVHGVTRVKHDLAIKPPPPPPYDPSIPLLGIYPEKTIILKDTCTQMLTTALVTITKTWRQPKCPSTEEWIKKIWYIYTTDHYSVIKKNKIMTLAARWMDLETGILTEVSQTQKDRHHMMLLILGV